MSLSVFEKKLIKQIESELPPAAPGVQVQVHVQGKKVVDLSVGDTFAYYDLASLTKVIFTTQALMKAFEQGLWNLDSKVSQFCPWFPHQQVTIASCLNHSSGLVWWLPFYQKVDLNLSFKERWRQTQGIIGATELDSKEVSVYSDVGFILLGHVLEAMYSTSLIEIWSKMKEEFYSRTTLDFHPNNEPKNPAKFYAPTERCRWRGKTMQGEVHDDNAWVFGGVSTHAGLFGSIDDLGWFAIFLRSQLNGISKTSVRQKTAQLFASRSRLVGHGDWALGYMMPSPGTSSSGQYLSPYSVGHTGFTGTSIWYDPITDTSVSILSNRVFLGREKKEFAALRPKIHNWIIEGMKRV